MAEPRELAGGLTADPDGDRSRAWSRARPSGTRRPRRLHAVDRRRAS